MLTPSSASQLSVEDENTGDNSNSMRVCTFKSKELFSNFNNALAGTAPSLLRPLSLHSKQQHIGFFQLNFKPVVAGCPRTYSSHPHFIAQRCSF